jgi:hypothetical protein
MTSKLTVQHYARLIADFKPLGQNQLDCKIDDMVFVEEEGKKFNFKKSSSGENGWALATKVGTNNKGFLPISYYSYVKYDPKSK